MSWFWSNLYDKLVPLVLKNDVLIKRVQELKHIKLDLVNSIGRKFVFSGFCQKFSFGNNKDFVFNPIKSDEGIYVADLGGLAWERVDNENDLKNRTYYVFRRGYEYWVKFGTQFSGSVNIWTPEKKNLSGEIVIWLDGIKCQKVNSLEGTTSNDFVYVEYGDEEFKRFCFRDKGKDYYDVRLEWKEYYSDLRLFLKILFRTLDVIKLAIDNIPNQKHPLECELEMLSFISEEIGLPLFMYQTAEDKRSLVNNIANIYKNKGTALGFAILRYLLDFSMELKQKWSQDYKNFIFEEDIDENSKYLDVNINRRVSVRI